MTRTEYVRLTFLPAGAARRRTVWAIKVNASTFRVCDVEGTDYTEPRPGVERYELIKLAPLDDATIKPARMDLKYARLEVVK